jgi:hypothetical protein
MTGYSGFGPGAEIFDGRAEASPAISPGLFSLLKAIKYLPESIFSILRVDPLQVR